MKKNMIIALAGMMLFAFTQCGGKGTAKGSKEFQDNMELYNKLEKAAKDAKTCDELQEAAMATILSALVPQKYTDEEKMTDSEKDEIKKLGEKLEKVIEERSDKLGCD